MKKPSLPSAPTMPNVPKRDYDTCSIGNCYLYDEDKLVDIMSRVTEYGKDFDPPPTVKVETATVKLNYDGDSASEIVFDIIQHVHLDDKTWEKALAKYDKQMILYNEKFDRFKGFKAQYEIDTREYEAWKKSEEEARDRRLLETLKKKYE